MAMNFRTVFLALPATLMIVPLANATVVFDALAGDAVTLFSNADNPVPTLDVTGSIGTLSRDNNALSHMVGNDNIQTLNGGSILPTDVVTVTWVVDQITGYTIENNNNGIEFGLNTELAFRTNMVGVNTVSRFRADSALANANRIGHGFGNIFNLDTLGGQTENEETVEEGLFGEGTGLSFEDGFTVVQTLTADGVTTQYSDIEVTDQAGTPTGGTVLTTVVDPFPDGVDFVDFVNNGRFYAGAQIADSLLGGDIVFSRAQIEITADAGGSPCDFDNDGDCDLTDIDALTQEIVAGTNNANFDLNGDGLVDLVDLNDPAEGWLTQGGAANADDTGGNPFLSGDANLDGVVDVTDFNLFNTAKFTVTGNWSQADFNADGSTDVTDFNIWNGNKFTSSNPAVVPEPASGFGLLIAMALLIPRLRRR